MVLFFSGFALIADAKSNPIKNTTIAYKKKRKKHKRRYKSKSKRRKKSYNKLFSRKNVPKDSKTFYSRKYRIEHFSYDSSEQMRNGKIILNDSLSPKRLKWFQKVGKSYYEAYYNKNDILIRCKLISRNEVDQVLEYYYKKDKTTGEKYVSKIRRFNPDKLLETYQYSHKENKVRIDNEISNQSRIIHFDELMRPVKVYFINSKNVLITYFILKYKGDFEEPYIQYIYDAATNKLQRKVKLYYNENKLKVRSAVFTGKGKLLEYFKYYYDTDDNLIRDELYSDRKMVLYNVYTYDEDGDLLAKKQFDGQTGNLVFIQQFQQKAPTAEDFR